MTRLIMRRGPQPGKVFELNSDVVTIGSGTKNSIVIQDNDVSRDHCRLIRVMADYELHDLDSVRGTYVSGQRVKAGWLLKPGTFIELGENITLEYERASAGIELEKVPARTVNESHSDQPAQESTPFLVMMLGPKPGHVYALKTPVVNIGRDLSNDIVIQDPEISRFHLSLRWSDRSYEVQDLGSTNGTSVNSQRLTAKVPRLMHSNDSITIATTIELLYTWQPDDVKVETGINRTTPRPSTKDLNKYTTSETTEANFFAAKSKRQTSKLGTGLQPGALVDHVFITYAREEWESIGAPIMVILQDAGYKVWVDQYLTQGNDDWMLAVEQALSECRMLLVIVSPESLSSRYVRLAYRYFFNREKPIVPLIYSGVEELPPELKGKRAVRYNSHDRRKSFDDLVEEIRQYNR